MLLSGSLKLKNKRPAIAWSAMSRELQPSEFSKCAGAFLMSSVMWARDIPPGNGQGRLRQVLCHRAVSCQAEGLFARLGRRCWSLCRRPQSMNASPKAPTWCLIESQGDEKFKKDGPQKPLPFACAPGSPLMRMQVVARHRKDKCDDDGRTMHLSC